MRREIDNFRILIILSIATWMFGMYVSYNAAPPPAELTSIYQWQGFGEVVPGPLGQRLYWVESALLLGGLVGMFFFSRIARGAVLAAILVNPLRTALGGIWVSSALEDTFWALHWTFFMFTIGMAFFSDPIKERFGVPQRTTQAP
jgi:hypothetical protein